VILKKMQKSQRICQKTLAQKQATTGAVGLGGDGFGMTGRAILGQVVKLDFKGVFQLGKGYFQEMGRYVKADRPLGGSQEVEFVGSGVRDVGAS
jgi:hypothetical protein